MSLIRMQLIKEQLVVNTQRILKQKYKTKYDLTMSKKCCNLGGSGTMTVQHNSETPKEQVATTVQKSTTDTRTTK